MRDITKQLSQVWEFHQAFNIEQNLSMCLGTQQKRKLRLNLFAEELGEFTKATYNSDHLEQLDGVIDMIYVLCGSAQYHGLGNVFSEFVKGEHDVSDRPIEGYPIAFQLVFKTNNIEAKYIHGSITLGELLQFHIELMSLALKLYNRLEKDYIVLPNSFEAAFDEVHNSNMSKLGKNGKPIYREDGKVLKGENYFKPNLSQFLTINK